MEDKVKFVAQVALIAGVGSGMLYLFPPLLSNRQPSRNEAIAGGIVATALIYPKMKRDFKKHNTVFVPYIK